MGESTFSEGKNSISINDVIEKTENKISVKPEDELRALNDTEDHIFLFASYDLCGSTKMKHKTKSWFSIVEAFFESENVLSRMKVWKFNGDEILFCSEITGVDEIIDILKEIFEGIDKIKKRLEATLEARGSEKIDIDLKATVWMACINDVVDNTSDNYRFIPKSGSVPIVEFSGMNIDEGFRLTHHGRKNRMLVDPKIVFIILLLYRCKILPESPDLKDYLDTEQLGKFKNFVTDEKLFEKIETCKDKFRIMEYKFSKGVWNDRKYPVIWYSENWGDNFRKTILYDDYIDNEQLLDVANDIENIKPTSKHSCDRLFTIFKQTEQIDTIKKILKKIEAYPKDGTESSQTITLDNTSKLYYMVVCVNRTKDKVLVFKRSKNRVHLKGVWDFGNVRHSANRYRSMSEIIQDCYRETFRLNIEVITDNKREDCTGNFPVKPFAICTVPRYGKLHNGILCFAMIKDELSDEEIIRNIKDKLNEAKKAFPQQYRYSDVKWVDYSNTTDIEKNQLTSEDVFNDSQDASIGKAKDYSAEEKYINNISVSIKEAVQYLKEKSEKDKKN